MKFEKKNRLKCVKMPQELAAFDVLRIYTQYKNGYQLILGNFMNGGKIFT